jgi:hypothetical protein
MTALACPKLLVSCWSRVANPMKTVAPTWSTAGSRSPMNAAVAALTAATLPSLNIDGESSTSSMTSSGVLRSVQGLAVAPPFGGTVDTQVKLDAFA